MAAKDAILRMLQQLVGLPVTQARRASGMAMFDFGALHEVVTRRGTRAQEGSFALHLGCAWRVREGDAIVLGSGDMCYPEDEHADWREFDMNRQRSRFDGRAPAWLSSHPPENLTVSAVEYRPAYAFALMFRYGGTLETFPADSMTGPDSEFWRLFTPGSSARHFVVGALGILEYP